MFKNKHGKVRSGWKILAVTAISFSISLIISLIIYFITGIIIATQDGFNLETLDLNEKGTEIAANVQFVITIIEKLIFLAVPILTWKYFFKRPLSNMGLPSIKKHGKELLIGLVFGIISISFVFILLLLSNNASVALWEPQFSTSLISYLVLYTIVGFSEEIMGRGFIMATLRQSRNLPLVLIVSSIIFALLHSINPDFGILPLINIALVGLLFAYMFIKSGNIWMPIGYHITWNYFQGNIFGFNVSGLDQNGLLTTELGSNKFISGGDFGPEGGIIVTIVVILSFTFVHFYYRDSTFDFIASDDYISSGDELVQMTNNSTDYETEENQKTNN